MLYGIVLALNRHHSLGRTMTIPMPIGTPAAAMVVGILSAAGVAMSMMRTTVAVAATTALVVA